MMQAITANIISIFFCILSESRRKIIAGVFAVKKLNALSHDIVYLQLFCTGLTAFKMMKEIIEFFITKLPVKICNYILIKGNTIHGYIVYSVQSIFKLF